MSCNIQPVWLWQIMHHSTACPLISRGHFSQNNSRKPPTTRPLGRGMCVFREFEVGTTFQFRSCCDVCNIVLYCTAIYRESRVSDKHTGHNRWSIITQRPKFWRTETKMSIWWHFRDNCTGSCHFDGARCNQWRQRRHFRFSARGVLYDTHSPEPMMNDYPLDHCE